MRRRRRRAATTEFRIDLQTQGKVGAEVRRYAEEKIARVGRLVVRPILFARAKLTEEANPSVERRAVAEASLDVDGRIVRAQVAARDMRTAVDLLEERLRRRLEELSEHMEARRQTGVSTPGEWRHGDLPTARPDYYPRPVEEREVMTHKTFADGPQTPEEAALDMRLLDYDFYLFTDAATDRESLIYLRDDGTLGLVRLAAAGEGADRFALEIHVDPAPPSAMSVEEAVERLNASGEPFVFFVSPETGRGNVLYRRYDGHYGLITPGEGETAVGG